MILIPETVFGFLVFGYAHSLDYLLPEMHVHFQREGPMGNSCALIAMGLVDAVKPIFFQGTLAESAIETSARRSLQPMTNACALSAMGSVYAVKPTLSLGILCQQKGPMGLACAQLAMGSALSV